MKFTPLVRKSLVLDEAMTAAILAQRKLQIRRPLEDALAPPTVYCEKPSWLRIPERHVAQSSVPGHPVGWRVPDVGHEIQPPWRPSTPWVKFTEGAPPCNGWYWVRWCAGGMEHLLFLRRAPNQAVELEAERWLWQGDIASTSTSLVHTAWTPEEICWRTPGTFLFVSEPAKVLRHWRRPEERDSNPKVVLKYAMNREEFGVSWTAGQPLPPVGRALSVPMAAARFWLEVEAVGLEQLQDITEEDAKAMGLSVLSKDGGQTWKWGMADWDGMPGTDDIGWAWADWNVSARKAFFRLWDNYYGQTSNSAGFNPWVWAGTVRLVDEMTGLRLRLVGGGS